MSIQLTTLFILGVEWQSSVPDSSAEIDSVLSYVDTQLDGIADLSADRAIFVEREDGDGGHDSAMVIVPNYQMEFEGEPGAVIDYTSVYKSGLESALNGGDLSYTSTKITYTNNEGVAIT